MQLASNTQERKTKDLQTPKKKKEKCKKVVLFELQKLCSLLVGKSSRHVKYNHTIH